MITDFIQKDRVPEQLFKEYEQKLPAQFIDFWQKYGFGTFYNGYLKAINPDDYKELLGESCFQGNESIPIFATAFGDLIIWAKNRYIKIVKYRYGELNVISAGADFFFDDITDGEFDDDVFSVKQYEEAVKKIGDLEYDECFGYVPLLALGGKETVNNLKKVKIREHIALMIQLTGGVW